MVGLDTLPERFWSKVVKTDGCWLWQGAHGPSGHGQIGFNRRLHRVGAVSLFLATGEWPQAGLCVCHHCDNPPCVRPDHLFVGTHKDNMHDCIAKGRFKFPVPRSGVRNNKAKMTDAKVATMRRLYGQGSTISALARRFKLARSTTREIVKGRNWRVPGVKRIPYAKPMGTLTASDLREIRALFDGGLRNCSELGRRYKVHYTTIQLHLGLRLRPKS